MCFRNCWYAANFESHVNNLKLKTGETVSRFELNSSVIMGSGQHRFGLLFLDTGAAERKGEFLATTHGQDGVE